MRSRNALEIGWVRWCLYWASWTAVGLLNTATQIIQDPELPKWKPLLWELGSLYTVGCLYPLVAYAARRFPFSRTAWVRTVAIHFGFLVVFSAMHTSGMVAARKIGYWIAGQPYIFGGPIRVLYEFYKDLILYPVLIGLTVGIDYYRKYRETELQSEQLQRRLAEAQLQNLRGQLNPHFLFNTLNLISSRMYEDVADADRMIARLSDLLRMTLGNGNETEVPLKIELEMLELYLDIMKSRFQDSVQVRIDVEPRARQAMVPSFLLQPLVENAFRHGVANKASGGYIEILGTALNGTLSLTVRDNGPGISGDVSDALHKGIGLSNSAARLRQLYGEQHRMQIRNRSDGGDGGLEIQIDVPARFDRR